jgi:hypothetical protein
MKLSHRARKEAKYRGSENKSATENGLRTARLRHINVLFGQSGHSTLYRRTSSRERTLLAAQKRPITIAGHLAKCGQFVSKCEAKQTLATRSVVRC